MRSGGSQSGGRGDGRRGGMNVGQIHRLPVSNQPGEERTEEKVGGRQRKVCFTPVWSAVNRTRGILMRDVPWGGLHRNQHATMLVLFRVRKNLTGVIDHIWLHCL